MHVYSYPDPSFTKLDGMCERSFWKTYLKVVDMVNLYS